MFTFKGQQSIVNWLSSLSNLIFPPVCPGCKNPILTHEHWLCMSCEIKLPFTPYMLQNENPITALFKGRLNIEMGTSFLLFTKNGLSQNLIHELKYKNNTQVGEELGRLFGQQLLGHVALPDALIPIPLHPDKEKKRGYNQSYFIAKGLGAALNVPVDVTAVQRVIANPSQTKLGRFKRWENVKNIFACAEDIPYKYVWIIDDTVTTGSTLEACATAILKHKKVKIGIATLAYAY